MDSDVVVDDILQKLMAKPIVSNTFMEDLGMEKKTTSPTMKLQLRQQQVLTTRAAFINIAYLRLGHGEIMILLYFARFQSILKFCH